MLAYAFKVAAVPERRLCAVAGLRVHAFYDIVLGIAVGKTVRHKEVKDVSIGEALVVLACHSPLPELVVDGFLLAVVGEVELYRARLGTLEVQIYEEIVRRVEADYRVDLCSRIVGCHVGGLYSLAVDHQLQ